MKVIFTQHAREKSLALKRLGWSITRQSVIRTLRHPQWKGISRFGQETAMSLLDSDHILRVIFNRDGDIMTVVTFHPARRGKYESTIQQGS